VRPSTPSVLSDLGQRLFDIGQEEGSIHRAIQHNRATTLLVDQFTGSRTGLVAKCRSCFRSCGTRSAISSQAFRQASRSYLSFGQCSASEWARNGQLGQVLQWSHGRLARDRGLWRALALGLHLCSWADLSPAIGSSAPSPAGGMMCITLLALGYLRFTPRRPRKGETLLQSSAQSQEQHRKSRP
jgi:hypothetical protein